MGEAYPPTDADYAAHYARKAQRENEDLQRRVDMLEAHVENLIQRVAALEDPMNVAPLGEAPTEGGVSLDLPKKRRKKKGDQYQGSIRIHFDGGGVTDWTGWGWVADDGGVYIAWQYGTLGEDSTTNIAEYNGLIHGLLWFRDSPYAYAHVYGDSQLVVKQATNVWEAKHPNMIPLHDKVQIILDECKAAGKTVSIKWVRRELNKHADSLATKGKMEERHGTRPVRSILNGDKFP